MLTPIFDTWELILVPNGTFQFLYSVFSLIERLQDTEYRNNYNYTATAAYVGILIIKRRTKQFSKYKLVVFFLFCLLTTIS